MRKPTFSPAYYSKRSRPGIFSSDDDVRQHCEARVLEAMEVELPRLSELGQHYGVDLSEDGAAFALAMAVAKDFVPNFAIRERSQKAGSRKKFSAFELVLEVEAIARACGVSIETAFKQMEEEKRPPFCRGRDSIKSSYYRMLREVEKIEPLSVLLRLYRASLESVKPWNAFSIKESFADVMREYFAQSVKN